MNYSSGQPSWTIVGDEMGACAAVSKTGVSPCGEIPSILRQCAKVKTTIKVTKMKTTTTRQLEHELKWECVSDWFEMKPFYISVPALPMNSSQS